jgi:ElaB/YqjD/DUF883 family membrane-anchored ribosome-binding protein
MSTEANAGHHAAGANQRTAGIATYDYDNNKARLMADLKLVVADAESLIKEAADSSADGFASLRTRFEKKLVETKAKLGRARAAVGGKTQQATDAAQAYVKENPWQSAGVSAAAGAVLGFCLGRRSNGSNVDIPPE